MALTEQDRTDINDLINLHGHLTDAGHLEQAGELFTPDVVYDVTDLGRNAIHGTRALREAALALGDANPVAHHVTNVVITQLDDHSARVRSKGIGINANGTVASVSYDDLVTHHPDGWKISHRKVTPRRAPLGGRHPAARAVLERFREASIARSTKDMAMLYAPDAVHEFPFTRKGMPSRLEGREEIMNWTTAIWRTDTFRYDRYRTLAVHDTTDPNTVVVEQEAIGESTYSGDFALPNIIVLTTVNGQITHLRDYVNLLAVEAALETGSR